MLLMVLTKGRDVSVKLIKKFSSSFGAHDDEEVDGGQVVEMTDMKKAVVLGGGPATRENRHLHMARSFAPAQKLRGGRSKRDKGATEPLSIVKASRGPSTTSPFHASAHIDHTKKGPSPPSSNIRVNSSGLLAVIKPDEDVKLDIAKDLPSLPPPTPSDDDDDDGAKPPAYPPPSSDQLKPGWTEHVDPSTNYPYWANDETGQTTWHKP